MKLFSIIAAIISLISVGFGFVDKNVLLIVSSLSMTIGFVFLYKYYQNKSDNYMRIFAVALAICVSLNLIRMFTEKGYF